MEELRFILQYSCKILNSLTTREFSISGVHNLLCALQTEKGKRSN